MKNLVMLTVVLLTAGMVFAAPSLEITSPPVQNNGLTGPIQDAPASQGQWFKHINPATGDEGLEEARTHEFYDNVEGHGGGYMGHLAIEGYATSVQYSDGMLTGFSIQATITNDTDTSEGHWADGSNSHNEFLSTPDKYVGTLFDTKLTAEFAIDQIAFDNWPGSATGGGPYNLDWNGMIAAVNHDELGWYCWTPDNGIPELTPEGDYLVPTWDFGDIEIGQSATRTMDFTCELLDGDPRLDAILASAEQGQDILLNRTTSLKISNWIEGLSIDDGTPYPQDPALSSDVSVFHNIPEPMTLCLLGLGGLMLRKRKA